MRSIFILLIALIINAYSIISQEDRQYKAKMDLKFTGEIKNDYDSVFQVVYILSANDLQFDIKEVKELTDSLGKIYESADILINNYQDVRREGDSVYMNMGIYVTDKPLVPLKYIDENGLEHKVILIAPWGEIKEPE